MKKQRVAIGIILLFVVISICLLGIERWNFKHISIINLKPYKTVTGKIRDLKISYNDTNIDIEGTYFETSENLTSINLRIVLISCKDNKVAYAIHTEYVEPEDDNKEDGIVWTNAKFQGRIYYSEWKSDYGKYNVYILNTSNGKNELINTNKQIEIADRG